MSRFGFSLAGEAHGPGLVGILTGLPRGLLLDTPTLHWLLTRRRTFPGRGARSTFECQKVQWLSGSDKGDCTAGGPLSFFLPNVDSSGAHSLGGSVVPLEYPRPGHADAAGATRWHLTDATPVAELASGRLTAAYCVFGHVCGQVLKCCGIQTMAHVVHLGELSARTRHWVGSVSLDKFIRRANTSSCQTLLPRDDRAFVELLQRVADQGDTLGGVVEVVAGPMPAGLGVPQPLEHRLDSRIGQLVMGIPGVKGLEIGTMSGRQGYRGSTAHDPFGGSRVRLSNRAGGVEGGMSNGQPLVVRAHVKPVPTLQRPLASYSLVDGQPGPAAVVRSDVCAVPSTALAVEAMVRISLAQSLLEDALVDPVGILPGSPTRRRVS